MTCAPQEFARRDKERRGEGEKDRGREREELSIKQKEADENNAVFMLMERESVRGKVNG